VGGRPSLPDDRRRHAQPGRRENGGLVVWRFGSEAPLPVDVDTGDAVVMHPLLPHSGSLNAGGTIRYAVYFRYLAEGWRPSAAASSQAGD
jgi:ectoine hydroxylase-related dioxygenase (phytanoyl-CoA dioxygenase family)